MLRRAGGRTRRLVLVLGWSWVALSIAALLVFGFHRATAILAPADPSDAFGVRYVEHPVVSLLHFGPGLLFITLAPAQFVPAIRRRHLRLHRMNGRLLAVLALVSGVYALAAGFVLPAYSGLPTLSATIVFGIYFLVALVMGVRAIRERRVAAHRAWMIRLFAVGLGVASIRAVIGVTQILTDVTFEEVFGVAFWIGLTVNALVAELWIRRATPPTDVARRKAA